MYTAKLITIPGKADATLCASHVFVTLEAIIQVPYLRLINLKAAKQIYQAIISVLNVLRHCMQPILLHV